jgi:hypothetical protein
LTIKKFEVNYGKGRYNVTLTFTITGNGFIGHLLGGEQPHIGAVVLSVPRPSLTEPAKTSCNSIVIPVLGHKDDEIAKPVAEEIAKKYNTTVALVAGIHVDKACPADIKELVGNCREAVQIFLEEYDKIIK